MKKKFCLYQNDNFLKEIVLSKKNVKSFFEDKSSSFYLQDKEGFRLFNDSESYFVDGINDDLLFLEKRISLAPLIPFLLSNYLFLINKRYGLEKIILFEKRGCKKETVEEAFNQNEITNMLRGILLNEKIECFKDSTLLDEKETILFVHVTCEKEIDFEQCKKIIDDQRILGCEVKSIEKDQYCSFAFGFSLRINDINIIRVKQIIDYFKKIKEINK